MEKTAHYFLVGIFTASVLLLLTGFLIWMAGPHDRKNLVYYTVEFRDSISGLEEGSKVKYKGVDVGKVMSTYLLPGDTQHVYVNMGVDKYVPVRSKTKAMLETQGITGLVQLELSTAENDTSPPETRPDMRYPVLQGEGSKLYQALEDLPVITAQILEMTDKFNNALDPATVSAIRSAIADTGHMAKSASTLVDKLKDDPSQLIYKPSSRGVEIPP